MSTTVLELFAGIGGLSAAWPEATIRAAYDINHLAARVYAENFTHPYQTRELASTSHRELQAWAADCWWLSPPCQPYCRLGAKRDLSDRRSAALIWLTQGLASNGPNSLVLENVIGFQESETWQDLYRVLTVQGYEVSTIELCPSQMGWPNLRPRFYALASRRGFRSWRDLPRYGRSLQSVIDPVADSHLDPCLWLDVANRPGLGTSIDRVDRHNRLAQAACFTSAYGKSLLRAGSYLISDHRFRRFTPREVARLLGFPDTFRLGQGSLRRKWKLLGQSLSLPAVRYVLSHLPNGPQPELPWLQPHAQSLSGSPS